MSTLSKVLAVLNVLLAIAFLVVVGLDYASRKAWMFAVLEQDFILKGLPVDGTETDVEGRALVKLIPPGKRMQKQLSEYYSVSELPQTQQAEVKTRYDALRAEIDAAGEAPAKKQILARALVPLARTWGQRVELQRKIRDSDVDALLASDGPFEAAFDEPLRGKSVADLGLEERREAIAHLLFNLSDNPDAQRRALAVVGLGAYVHEVDAQAKDLQSMVPQIQHAMEADLAAFEVEHKDLVQQIVIAAERVRQLDDVLQKQTLLAQQHATLVAARKGDVQRVTAEIDEARKATDRALQGQSRLEEALFQADRASAVARERNEQLLRQIDALDLGR